MLCVGGPGVPSTSPNLKRSTDSGLTWTIIANTGIGTGNYAGIACSADGQYWVAGVDVAQGSNTLLRSNDSGVTFTVAPAAPNPGYFRQVAATSAGDTFMGTLAKGAEVCLHFEGRLSACVSVPVPKASPSWLICTRSPPLTWRVQSDLKFCSSLFHFASPLYTTHCTRVPRSRPVHAPR